MKISFEKDLLSINILSVLLILVIALIPDSPLRTVFGIPFVIFFPGYTLLSVLFPANKDLGGIERLALSIGLSLAVVPLMGLVLNYTPLGIRLVPILAALFAFTFIMSMLTFFRRGKLSPQEKLALSLPVKLPNLGNLPKLDRLFLAGFLVAIVALSGLIVYLASAPKIGERFTEFYLLGPNGTLADYPTNITLGGNGTVIMGITNHEYNNVSYRVVVNLENQALQAFENIQLSHGMNWNQSYTFTPTMAAEKTQLQFKLYKDDLAEAYRSLQLWVTVRLAE